MKLPLSPLVRLCLRRPARVFAAANGSSTAYAAGANYAAGTNLVLYTKWNALPETLVSFHARQQGPAAALRWEVGAEKGLLRYEVERSAAASLSGKSVTRASGFAHELRND